MVNPMICRDQRLHAQRMAALDEQLRQVLANNPRAGGAPRRVIPADAQTSARRPLVAPADRRPARQATFSGLARQVYDARNREHFVRAGWTPPADAPSTPARGRVTFGG